MNLPDLLDAIEITGHKPVPYSGRGMMGHQCIACKLQPGDNGRNLPQEGAVYDQLGKGSVIYWPSVKAPEDMMHPDDVTD